MKAKYEAALDMAFRYKVESKSVKDLDKAAELMVKALEWFDIAEKEYKNG